MKAKTELLLYQLLWTADKLVDPRLRNLHESFEGWAYKNGFLRQVQRLEASGFLEAEPDTFDGTRFHRLTEAGRIAALGGRDPEAAWATVWDQKWRLFLFDVPETERSIRKKLTRALSGMGCGCLQGSVWLAATRPADIEKAFREEGTDCAHLMILEAESRGPQVDRRMAETAWDFERVNALYQQHMKIMERCSAGTAGQGVGDLTAWAREENAAWLAAVRNDPLLPEEILPKGYLGRRAWQKRMTTLARAGRLADQLWSSEGAPE